MAYAGFAIILPLLRDIFQLTRARRFLEEEELGELEELTTKFGDNFPRYFPERGITRKMHSLIFDVPIFARKHGTVGYFSEQAGESLHKLVNAQLRRCHNINNKEQKLVVVLKCMDQRKCAKQNIIKPIPVKCVDCHTFFKNGLCQTCQKQRPLY